MKMYMKDLISVREIVAGIHFDFYGESHFPEMKEVLSDPSLFLILEKAGSILKLSETVQQFSNAFIQDYVVITNLYIETMKTYEQLDSFSEELLPYEIYESQKVKRILTRRRAPLKLGRRPAKTHRRHKTLLNKTLEAIAFPEVSF